MILPDYQHIKMHQTFTHSYFIDINSTDLSLAQTEFIIKRTDFMNLTIDFNSHLTFGDHLQVLNYHINNDKIIQNSTYIRLECLSLGIDTKLLINYAANSCLMCPIDDIKHTDCVSCYKGIPIFSHNIEHYGSGSSTPSTHLLYIQSNDTLLTSTQTEITLNPCGVGSGLSKDGEDPAPHCIKCPENYINLYQQDDVCHACLTSEEKTIGYSCKGSSNILVDYNHWMSIKGYSNGWQYIFKQDIKNESYPSYDIISSTCPPLYCCQSQNGCLYNNNAVQEETDPESEEARRRRLLTAEGLLCAIGRDPSVPLCGGCLDIPRFMGVHAVKYAMVIIIFI